MCRLEAGGPDGVRTGSGDGARRTTQLALPALDSARLIGDLFRLSHDSMGGRATASPQNAKARARLIGEFRRLGLEPLGGSIERPFVMPARRTGAHSVRGVNVIGLVRGRADPEQVIVVSAHFDHRGTRNGVVFNGADDNASGTAAVLAMAACFRSHAPEHTLLFALWDAEEIGLVGSRAFIANPPLPLARIVANVNLDMVSRNVKDELYAAGATPWPRMRPILEDVVPRAGVTLRADYHRATDDPERIEPGFYYRAARTITAFVERFDRASRGWPQ